MAVLAIVDDLLFRSKIEATATHAGGEVRLVRASSLEPALVGQGWVLVLLDLSVRDAVAVAAELRRQLPSAPIVGFASHVQVELQQQAREAGCTEVVPRSVFVAWLPQLVLGRLPG